MYYMRWVKAYASIFIMVLAIPCVLIKHMAEKGHDRQK